MRRPVNSFIRISQNHGSQPYAGYFGRHLGTDYSTPVGTVVLAPASGKITMSGRSSSLGEYYELREDGSGRIHRIAHLSKRSLPAGTQVTEGQEIGKSGNTGISTGPHVHWDVRKANTVWNGSFNDYYDPEKLILPPPQPQPNPNMPAVGSKIQLIPVDTRTTYRAGTTTVAGQIKVKDNTYVYTVRGYDSKYPGRILINSASAGGDGVALALYYVSGAIIPGWKVL